MTAPYHGGDAFTVALSPDRAIVITDTLATHGERVLGLARSKVAIAHTAAFAVVCRGPGKLVASIAASIVGEADADQASARLEERAAAERNWPRLLYTTELIVVGHSPAAGRVVAITHRFGPDGYQQTQLADGITLLPGGAWKPDLPSIATLIDLAHAHAMRPLCGGVMHLTDCSSSGCTIKVAGVFARYDELAAAYRDPNDHAVRAWRSEGAVRERNE